MVPSSAGKGDGAMGKSFEEAEHAGWLARAAGYDAHFTAITDQVIEPIFARIGELAGLRLLDVCCGPGHLVGVAAARGADVTGLDFAASMVTVARSHYPDADFVEGDAAALPFGDGSFGCVVCAYGVMHLPRPGRRNRRGLPGPETGWQLSVHAMGHG